MSRQVDVAEYLRIVAMARAMVRGAADAGVEPFSPRELIGAGLLILCDAVAVARRISPDDHRAVVDAVRIAINHDDLGIDPGPVFDILRHAPDDAGLTTH